jgi:SAM-dependent methyltransferase
MLGLEIAPYHNPIAPKSEGWNCLSLDINDAIKLRELASNDSSLIANGSVNRIENVDFVASAGDLYLIIANKNLLGSFDYICSSHNYEHLPNPLKFLRDCGAALKANRYLSMAIPDKRFTFDCVRPLTSTKDHLRAFFCNTLSPDPFDVFDFESSHVLLDSDEKKYSGSLVDSFERLKIRFANPTYIDTHVSIFTKDSFFHIFLELSILGLIPFEIVDLELSGIEFIVHLKNIGYESVAAKVTSNIQLRNELNGFCFLN